MTEAIDWTTFDKYSKDLCHCRCGRGFLSHVKGVWRGERFVQITRDPCPGCAKNDDCLRVSSQREKMTIESAAEQGELRMAKLDFSKAELRAAAKMPDYGAGLGFYGEKTKEMPASQMLWLARVASQPNGLPGAQIDTFGFAVISELKDLGYVQIENEGSKESVVRATDTGRAALGENA
jgi:hypothetical protein